MTDWINIAHESHSRGGQQRVGELVEALRFLEGRGPIHRIVEIGVHDAGTLWAWGQLTAARFGSQVFGVDITDRNVRHQNLEDLSPRDAHLFVGDSSDEVFVSQVCAELNGPIDFLFIDGDHAREAVVADYLRWRDRVSPAGVIGFHDISVASAEGWQDVLAMQTDALSIEFQERSSDVERMGIGLLINSR